MGGDREGRRMLNQNNNNDNYRVVPGTIHAAFDKAAQYFGITIIHIDMDEKTGKVNLAKVRRAISPNTVKQFCTINSSIHYATKKRKLHQTLLTLLLTI